MLDDGRIDWGNDVREGRMVRWRDPRNAELFNSGPGPFRAVRVREDEVVPVCTCGGNGGGLLDDGHSFHCEVRGKRVAATFVTVIMNGRHCSFDADLFEIEK